MCASLPGTLLFWPGHLGDGRWYVDFEIDPDAFVHYGMAAELARALNPVHPEPALPFMLRPVMARNPMTPQGEPATLHWRLETTSAGVAPETVERLLRARLPDSWPKRIHIPELLSQDLARAAIKFVGTRDWAKRFPSGPGVYLFLDKGVPVYAGETGSLRGRMLDVLDTRNHGFRRKLGARHFGDHPGYRAASASMRFPDDIEDLLVDYLDEHVSVVVVEVSIGRKEIEEALIATHSPEFNVRGSRETS